jgi:hypothetical protein
MPFDAKRSIAPATGVHSVQPDIIKQIPALAPGNLSQ